MTSGSSIELRRRLVGQLRHRGHLTDPRVARAFLEVPREAFLPLHAARHGVAAVYHDEAIVVRRDPVSGAPRSSSSQPAIMAVMLEMLDTRPGHRVLEIGAGTGYNAALLHHLTRPGGLVVAVDVDDDTAAGAAAGLARSGARAHVVVADGRTDLPLAARFDRVMVTASSAEVPPAWHRQLAPEGLLVVPLRLDPDPTSAHAIVALARSAIGFDSAATTGGGFMPLRDRVGGARPGRDDPPEGTPAGGGSGRGEPSFLPRGFAIPRDLLGCLAVSVRYTVDPPPARWRVRHPDHWIGIDVDPEREAELTDRTGPG